jgi:hypothetical protein
VVTQLGVIADADLAGGVLRLGRVGIVIGIAAAGIVDDLIAFRGDQADLPPVTG